MAQGSLEIFSHSVIATAALINARAVTAAGALPAAAARCLGFAKFDAAIGQRVNVAVLGSTVAEAGAAIALGAALELDALGRVITKAAGVTVGSALTAAVNVGDKIEIVLIPN
jgi:Uncharacterized conserved protein (DUF2190)